MDALYCAFCLVARKNDLKRAITICNGQACCFDHLYYVQGGEYNKILAIIKLDEAKQDKADTQETVKNLNTVNKHLKDGNKRLSRFLQGS